METIGFLGLGNMGRPMAKNLVAAGYTVRAWNRTPGKAPPGVQEAGSPREAVAGAHLAVSMLSDDTAVQAVMLGDNGVLAGLKAGGIHVGMSTISTALSARLAEAHRAAKQHFVAAPVLGRPDAAEKKLLWILPGGDDTAVAECMPLFAALGQGTFPMGGAPQASLAKLVANFMIAAHIEMLGEGLTLAEKGGLDPMKLLLMLGGSVFGSPVFKNYGARVAATEFEPAGFSLPLGLKDIQLALKSGEELRVPLPLAAVARDHALATLARGRERYDFSGLSSAIREAAGLGPTRS